MMRLREKVGTEAMRTEGGKEDEDFAVDEYFEGAEEDGSEEAELIKDNEAGDKDQP